MCLEINKDSRKQIAKKDIVVYKTLSYRDNIYRTSYRHFPVEIGKLYKSGIRKNKRWLFIINKALHSFKLLTNCKNDAWEEYGYNGDKEYVIVECIIPKGAVYYIGKFSNAPCYASNKLKYIKVI